MSKYTPKPGDVVNTPETDYPMTVEAYDPARHLCALVGFAPGSQELVRLPQVCPDSLTLAPTQQ